MGAGGHQTVKMGERLGRSGRPGGNFLLPSAVMGEYEEPVKRVRRPKGLMPLENMLEYGPLPLPGGYQRRERKPKVYAAYGGKRDESPPPPPPPPAPRKTSRRIGEGSQSRKRSQNKDPNQPAGGTSLWSSGSLKRPPKPVRTATRESFTMRSYTSTIRKDSFSA